MNKVKYVHYGMNCFIPKVFQPIQNIPFRNKPNGGLWASRKDARFGWKEWSEENEFHLEGLNRSFEFVLSDNANVMEIHSVSDLKKLPQQDISGILSLFVSKSIFLDFEKILKSGVDAIELFLSDDMALYYKLYGWDCDCILIMNPDIVEA